MLAIGKPDEYTDTSFSQPTEEHVGSQAKEDNAVQETIIDPIKETLRNLTSQVQAIVQDQADQNKENYEQSLAASYERAQLNRKLDHILNLLKTNQGEQKIAGSPYSKSTKKSQKPTAAQLAKPRHSLFRHSTEQLMLDVPAEPEKPPVEELPPLISTIALEQVPDFSAPYAESALSSSLCKLPRDPVFGDPSTNIRMYPSIYSDTIWKSVFDYIRDYTTVFDAWRPFPLGEYAGAADMWSHMHQGVCVRETKCDEVGIFHMYYPPIAAVNLYFSGLKSWRRGSQTAAVNKFSDIVSEVNSRIQTMSLAEAGKVVDQLKAANDGSWEKMTRSLKAEAAQSADSESTYKRRRLNEDQDTKSLSLDVKAAHLIVLRISESRKTRHRLSLYEAPASSGQQSIRLTGITRSSSSG